MKKMLKVVGNISVLMIATTSAVSAMEPRKISSKIPVVGNFLVSSIDAVPIATPQAEMVAPNYELDDMYQADSEFEHFFEQNESSNFDEPWEQFIFVVPRTIKYQIDAIRKENSVSCWKNNFLLHNSIEYMPEKEVLNFCVFLEDIKKANGVIKENFILERFNQSSEVVDLKRLDPLNGLFVIGTNNKKLKHELEELSLCNSSHNFHIISGKISDAWVEAKKEENNATFLSGKNICYALTLAGLSLAYLYPKEARNIMELLFPPNIFHR